MDIEGIKDLIEELAGMFVMADVEDLSELARMHTHFTEIIEWGGANAQVKVTTVAQATTNLLEKIIMAEADKPADAMEIVQKSVECLQHVFRDGRDPSEIEIPAALLALPELSKEEAACCVKPEPEPETLQDPALESTPVEIMETPGEEIIIHKGGLEFLQDIDMVHDFMQEAIEHLESADEQLLVLESDPQNDEALNAVFRAFHTIKGVAGFLELRNIQLLAHEAENMLDLMRKPHITVTQTSLDLAFESTDHLKQMMHFLADAVLAESVPLVPETLTALIPRLRIELSALQGKGPPAVAALQTDPVEPAPTKTTSGKHNQLIPEDSESIRLFIPDARERLEDNDNSLMILEKDPRNREAIHAVFRTFHTIKGESAFLELMPFHKLAHETESLLEEFRDDDETTVPQESIDLIFESNDLFKRLVGGLGQAVEDGTPLLIPPELQQLVDKIRKHTAISPAEVADPTATFTPASASAAPQNVVPSAKKKAPVKSGGAKVGREALKVDAGRLDLLIDTIGELVIAEAMVGQSKELQDNRSPELRTHMNHLNKITRELQQIGMGLRMVTVRSTFNRMARVVRDLTKKIGKEVDFITEGEDTELDKTVVDLIGDPLLHMVRNAVDHGLESPAERAAAGKDDKGAVILRAFHKGGSIYIEVQDNGRGLNRTAILQKAVERAVIREEDIASLSDRQINNLVFAPGFSTAAEVTDVSGRGVGMDVVKRNIENLRGTVEISSEQGKGSVFTIKLPLTLAIIDGMLTRIGEERYVIPTLSIVRTVQPGTEDLSTMLQRGEVLKIDDQLIPLFRLSELFEVKGAEADPRNALIVIVESDGLQAGILTDELLGQQQIVIKSLGDSLRDLMGISGGAILPDGEVGLIIDVASLVKLAHQVGRAVSRDMGKGNQHDVISA